MKTCSFLGAGSVAGELAAERRRMKRAELKRDASFLGMVFSGYSLRPQFVTSADDALKGDPLQAC